MAAWRALLDAVARFVGVTVVVAREQGGGGGETVTFLRPGWPHPEIMRLSFRPLHLINAGRTFHHRRPVADETNDAPAEG